MIEHKSSSRTPHEDLKITFKGKEIILVGLKGKEIDMLKILSGGSFDNPIPRSLLIEEEMRGSRDGDKTAARNRVNSRISIVRKDLEKYDLTVAVKKSESDQRTGGYYFGEKGSFVRKKKRMRWNIMSGVSSENNITESGNKNDKLEISAKKPGENEISTKGDIFVKTEKSDPIEGNKLQEEPAENQTPVVEDIFNTEGDGEEEETSEEEKVSGDSSEFLIPSGFDGFRFPKPKEKLDPRFLLTENELCIIAVSLYYRGVLLKINTASLDIGERDALFNRVAMKLEKANQARVDLEKESLLPAIDKLKKFQEDPEKYLRACDKTKKAVLKCFDGVKITDDLLSKLFPEKEQVKLIQEAKAKREV